jgi:hypothetical protein
MVRSVFDGIKAVEHTGDQGTTWICRILFTVRMSLSTVMMPDAPAMEKELKAEVDMKL